MEILLDAILIVLVIFAALAAVGAIITWNIKE
jgi:hypothetical protein